MQIIDSPVESIIELGNNIILLKVYSPEIASTISPGQFINVRVSEQIFPLLRRPFSVCDVDGDYIFLMFNILGEGTKILANKAKGETIDILGPLGHGFDLSGDYETAVIVAGGLGASPFAFFMRRLNDTKKVICFIGGRTHKDVITYGMTNVQVATDDGSLGLKGNVVDLLNQNIDLLKSSKVKIFACGPTAMLRALKNFAVKNGFDGQVSTECAMACGFGICQGCPIPKADDPEANYLVCKDGPVFNMNEVIL